MREYRKCGKSLAMPLQITTFTIFTSFTALALRAGARAFTTNESVLNHRGRQTDQ